MKKLDKEFFIVYSYPVDYYDSAIGINELAEIFKRSRSNMLRSLKKEYIKMDNKKYFIIRESDLQKGV